MSRLLRIALLVALAAALAPARTASAAPPDREQGSFDAVAHELLARLWQPLARLFSASDAEVGPTSDPDGVSGSVQGATPPTAPSEGTNNSEGDVGPTSDPNG